MLPKWVDEYLPPRGPCLICGGDDARHRLTDAIVGCVRAGDPVEQVARDYEVPVALVQRLAEER